MKQEFSAFMRMMMGKEKTILEEDRHQNDHTPLLATPPLNQRLQIGSESTKTTKKDVGKLLIPNPPKIELFLFTGANPRDWIKKCNKYCLNYQILEEQKLEVIEMYLE